MTTINPKLPYWHHQLVLSWYHHQPESHQQSLNKVLYVCTPGPIDRTPETPGSGKKSLGPEPHQLTNASYVESGEVMSICVNEARQYLNIYISKIVIILLTLEIWYHQLHLIFYDQSQC